jgi:hypothetical protein
VLSGTVLDSSNSGVPGSKTRLVKGDGTSVGETAADVIGVFRFEGIAPGNYRVIVEHDGFEVATVPVKLVGWAPVQIVIRLKVAAIRSEVSVNDQSPELSTETAENCNTATLNRQVLGPG